MSEWNAFSVSRHFGHFSETSFLNVHVIDFFFLLFEGTMIYLCGGLHYSHQPPLSTVECFDTVSQQSNVIPELTLPFPLLGSAFCLVD